MGTRQALCRDGTITRTRHVRSNDGGKAVSNNESAEIDVSLRDEAGLFGRLALASDLSDFGLV